jgi:predicted O-linked N-acetylglucosamine transferase (SPINDLY family)
MSNVVFKEAMDFFTKGHLNEAKLKYKEALLLDKKNLDVYYFLARIAYLQKDYDLGIDLAKKFISLNSKDPKIYNLLGLLYQEKKNYNKAFENYKKIIRLDSKDIYGYFNLGVALAQLGDFKEALENFKKIINIKKDFFLAYDSIGFCFLKLNKYREALDFLNVTINLKIDHSPAYINRAIVKSKLNDFDGALTDFNNAISIHNNVPEYYYERGIFLRDRNFFLKALQDFEYAYLLKPNYKLLLGDIIILLSSIINFKNKNIKINQVIIDIKKDLISIFPGQFLLINDHLDLQFKLAKNFSRDSYVNNFDHKKFYFIKNNKIKVAYFSSDFGEHPIGRQIIELFELHDRNNFEIYLFSLKQRPNCLLRQRIIKASDHFIEVHDKTFLEIIDLVRSLNIDIAIDLNGYTAGRKSEIFCSRVAPIQVNYLGYPGTMGADFMDYIIADKIVIPKEYMEKYSEKIVYLPNSFMVNDRLKKISEQKLTRSDFGLKDDQFVFCCFNAVYKITEEIFKTWMNILNKVSNSILWLKEPNEIAKNNIIKEFEKNGIYPERVSFLKFSEHSAYLATHRLADLYLDTFPYNAHSMASESLWAGLPLITLIGKSFHTRVAASILNAINLPELITNSLEEYEKLAIELALNPQKLKNIKNKLNSNIKTAPLFDTPPYTKNLESAYKKMYERYQSDQKPDHIYINE